MTLDSASGVVKSYDSSSGFFEIGYNDGDSEEIDLSELAAVVDVDGVPSDQSPSVLNMKPSRVGRRPKKKRRFRVSSNSGFRSEKEKRMAAAVYLAKHRLRSEMVRLTADWVLLLP